MQDQEKAQAQVATATAQLRQPQQVNIHLDKVLAELGKTVMQLRVTEEQYGALQNQANAQITNLSFALKHANEEITKGDARETALELELRDALRVIVGLPPQPLPPFASADARLDELLEKHPIEEPGSGEAGQAKEPTPIDRPAVVTEPRQAIEPLDH